MSQLRNTTPARDPAPDDLICPAQDIFDRGAVQAALNDGICVPPGDLRKMAVGVLSDAMQRGRDAIAAALADNPLDRKSVV